MDKFNAARREPGTRRSRRHTHAHAAKCPPSRSPPASPSRPASRKPRARVATSPSPPSAYPRRSFDRNREPKTRRRWWSRSSPGESGAARRLPKGKRAVAGEHGASRPRAAGESRVEMAPERKRRKKGSGSAQPAPPAAAASAPHSAAAASASSMTARSLVEDKDLKFLFVGGKGGVGKTTTSSSVRARHARRTRRALGSDPRSPQPSRQPASLCLTVLGAPWRRSPASWPTIERCC